MYILFSCVRGTREIAIQRGVWVDLWLKAKSGNERVFKYCVISTTGALGAIFLSSTLVIEFYSPIKVVNGFPTVHVLFVACVCFLFLYLCCVEE